MNESLATTTSRAPALAEPTLAWTAAFRPVSLEALNDKAAMLERLDNKYVVQASALAAALPDLAAAFDILEIQGRRSFVYETCYFDDPELRSYYDHHQGRRQRVKVRVRRYVDAALCFVEVKLKDKRGMTIKRRMPYDPQKYGRLDERACAHIEKAFSSLYGRAFGRSLEPVLDMSYRRATLVAKQGGERMTIDSDIAFEGLAASGATPAEAPSQPPALHRTGGGVFIVETKSAHGRGIADEILRRQHQHPTNACSKYCVGMSVTGAVPRFNRFRPALRKLGALGPFSGEPAHAQ